MNRTIRIDDQISLKFLVESDARTIFNYINTQRDYLGEWLPFVQFTHEVKDSKGFVDMTIELRKIKKDYVYKICYDDRMIGLIGTKETDYLNKNTELGYWLSQDYQGQGIMTKVVEKLTALLFDEMGIERIQICCAVGNEKSIAIPKRLGYIQEGIKRNGEWAGNLVFRDLIVFSKLKSESNS